VYESFQCAKNPSYTTNSLSSCVQDVESLGAVGKVVMVNHGFARNFLVPQRLAAVRRGKQSGSISHVHDRMSTGPSEPSSSAPLHNDQDSGERMQFAIDQQKKRLEAAVKKLTTIPLVSSFS